MKLIVATRGSALALWQTEWVIQQLRAAHGHAIEVEILTVRTQGDRVQHLPISRIGGKGIFVKEIEESLLSHAADFAVHSLKDLPAEQPPGLCIAAVPAREDARDALVLPEAGVQGSGVQAFRRSGVQDRPDRSDQSDPSDTPVSLDPERPNARTPEHLISLPLGAAVGTTSRRRGALLMHERPDLRIQMLRGNLDTRLHKLDIGQHDAIVLAAAGLRRLGFAHRISELLPIDRFVPCVGQGALAIEARVDDRRVLDALAALEHEPTRLCVAAERTVLRRLEGDCHTPLGAHASLSGGQLLLHGMLSTPDGADLVRVTTHASAGDPMEAGRRLADLLIDAGGERILTQLGTKEGDQV
jgi:hydroxymethylbilane synthase